MTNEITLHSQLAQAHQTIVESKLLILTLQEELKTRELSYKEELDRIESQIKELEGHMSHTQIVLPQDMPYVKTLRDEGYDYIETLPEDLETIRGIGPDKAGKILMFLSRNGQGD